MRKLTAMIILAAMVVLSFCSCKEKKAEYYSNYFDTGSDTLSVSVAYDTGEKDGKKKEIYYTDSELDDIFTSACGVFSESLSYVAADSTKSQLGEINSRVNTVFDCDGELIGLLNTAYSLSAQTAGAFQPCGGSLTELLRAYEAPSETDLAAALSHIGTDKITFNGTSVTKGDLDTKIDLYACADGYALQKTVEFLQSEGCLYGFVTLNSMAGVFGERKNSASFDIGVYAGDDETRLGYMRLKSGYIAVSDADIADEIDFTKGTLADCQLDKALVWAADAVSADALASAAYVGGADRTLSLYSDGSLDFEAVLVHTDGSVVITDGAAESGLYAAETTTQEK